jgi:hypothetical protein
MERRWLTFALAALALSAGPVLAEEASPEEKPPVPATQVAQSGAGESAPADKPESAEGSRMAAQGQPAPPVAPPADTEKQPEEPAPKFTYGGSADFYYSINFNDPFTGTNALRAFDVEDEKGIHLGLIDLWAQYARDPIGFRIDVDFGPTARLVNAFEPSRSNVWEHIQQAYVSANLNRKGTTYVDLGKWVTTAGAEVIEPKDNWLYTRGLLFTWAIPFYHFGGRGYHYFNDTDYVMGAIHRGYNAVGGPGHGLGFALAGSKKLSDEWTFIGNYYGGEEGATAGAGEAYRNLVDLILLYNPTDSRWAYTFNVDYAQQSSSKVGGLSAQAKYALSPKSYAALRGEFLLDDDFLGSDMYALTAGYTHIFSKHIQGRAEFRYDWASEDLFANDRRGTFTGNQPTFLLAAILSY